MPAKAFGEGKKAHDTSPEAIARAMAKLPSSQGDGEERAAL
jgi:hypothetical protein